MMPIENAARLVPMMFRAQIENRCQLQRIIQKQTPDIIPWEKEWTQEIYPQLPITGAKIEEREYEIAWRMVSNSGVDDAIIRPVIGARGWPYYPGSSMKGVFRRACTSEQVGRYCGQKTGKNDYEPGILRFHGGYPIDDSWQYGLVDIVHPQQSNQVGMEQKTSSKQKTSSASAMISLYQPTLRFGISSNVDLAPNEWEEIWQIWDKAIQTGIGGRTSAGYGQTNTPSKVAPIYRCQLKGRGQAAKLLDGEGEFRPNIFRAALRGHALRIFGGLTDANSAERLVGDLFGSIDPGCPQGLLSFSFIEEEVTLGIFRKAPTYEAIGEVNWHLTSSLDQERRKALKDLVTGLTHFAMIFGGFGKSWRRADHRLFFEDYYNNSSKSLIGCHWEWADHQTLQRDPSWHLSDPAQLSQRIGKLMNTALVWMELQGVKKSELPTTWRESWHPNNVQVWGRIAENNEDSSAIRWFHGGYSHEQTISKSSLTGKMGQFGRIWHRMYPVIRLVKDEANPRTPQVRRTPKFIELFTIFPDRNSSQCQTFIEFLHQQDNFTKLWGN